MHGLNESLFIKIVLHDYYYSMLKASKRGFTYPKYVWIMRDDFVDYWWTNAVDKSVVNCSDDELELFLDKALSFRLFPLLENDTVITDAGIVSKMLTVTSIPWQDSCTSANICCA